MRLQTSVKSENLHKKADGGCLMRVSTIQRDESNAQGNQALFAMVFLRRVWNFCQIRIIAIKIYSAGACGGEKFSAAASW